MHENPYNTFTAPLVSAMTDEMLDKTVNADNLIEISKAEEEGTYAFKMVAKGVTRIFICVGPSLYATPFLATFITNLPITMSSCLQNL